MPRIDGDSLPIPGDSRQTAGRSGGLRRGLVQVQYPRGFPRFPKSTFDGLSEVGGRRLENDV